MRAFIGFGLFASCLGGSGAGWLRLGFSWARLFLSGAGFGFRVLIFSGSGQSWLVARQAAIQASEQRPNKALHPTAYSSVRFGRSSLRSLRFRRRVSLVVSLLRDTSMPVGTLRIEVFSATHQPN